VKFNNVGLLEEAVTHPSFANQQEGSQSRLELLGDKVLGFFVTEYLYQKHPHLPADALTDAVALFVNNRFLCSVGRSLGVDSVLRWRPAVCDERLRLFIFLRSF